VTAVTIKPIADVVDSRTIADIRRRAPQSGQGCTSRPLIIDDIHHSFDHSYRVSVT
jgi:hypothetical protein